jgi:N-acetylmuramoyl-L-alanine amidase
MKIYLDIGHGGADPGAVANGIEEKYINFTVAQNVKGLLEKAGHEVLMSRDGDTGTDAISQIINSNKKCDEWGADYAYSIHHNAGGGIGYDLVYSNFKAPTLAMVNAIAEEFAKIGRPKHQIFIKTYVDEYGEVKDWYGIMRDTNCPCIIVEPCFIDSTDVAAVKTMDSIIRIGQAIAKGILAFIASLAVITPPQPVKMTLAEALSAITKKGLLPELEALLVKIAQNLK